MKFWTTSQRISPNGISSPEEFSRILERERERSDRSGQGFSLVLFETKIKNQNNDLSRVLIDCILSRRVRAIDEVGWYKEGSIATLLAFTSHEGAWKFAKDVMNGLPPGSTVPNCRVYTYPSPWHSNGKGGGEQKRDISDSIQPHAADDEPPSSSGQIRYTTDNLDNIMGRPIPLWKRFLDILGALVGLILFAPFFLLIAFFIKIVSPGPVFYRQERIGYLGRKFTFWKFRTMQVNNDEKIHLRHISQAIEKDFPIGKLDDLGDNRIIPMGKFLRKFCLDELPQLVNVLLGDMSLVGPRPCLDYEAEKFLQWQKRRFNVLPGMSGLWQVSGKNRTTFKEMTRLDIRYSRKLSPGLDAKILFLTVPAILGMAFNSFTKKMAIDKESPTFVPSRRDLSHHRKHPDHA